MDITRATTYLFDPKVRVLGRRVFLLLSQKPPDGNRAKDDTIDGNSGNPDIDETRREVESERAHWAPALFIAAEALARRGGGREIVASQLL